MELIYRKLSVLSIEGTLVLMFYSHFQFPLSFLFNIFFLNISLIENEKYCVHYDEFKVFKITNNYIEGTKEFLKSIMELQTVKPHVLAQPNKVRISRDCNCSRDLSASWNVWLFHYFNTNHIKHAGNLREANRMLQGREIKEHGICIIQISYGWRNNNDSKYISKNMIKP